MYCGFETASNLGLIGQRNGEWVDLIDEMRRSSEVATHHAMLVWRRRTGVES